MLDGWHKNLTYIEQFWACMKAESKAPSALWRIGYGLVSLHGPDSWVLENKKNCI
jgi:hypothetical protein